MKLGGTGGDPGDPRHPPARILGSDRGSHHGVPMSDTAATLRGCPFFHRVHRAYYYFP
jgi:hypothetical protein